MLYKGEESEQFENEDNMIDICGIKVGEWVVVVYAVKKYPGKVTSKGEAAGMWRMDKIMHSRWNENFVTQSNFLLFSW